MPAKYIARPKTGKADDRPTKPDGCPLYPHRLGYWANKIHGKLSHFGRWGRIRNGKMERLPGDGLQEALAKFNCKWGKLADHS